MDDAIAESRHAELQLVPPVLHGRDNTDEKLHDRNHRLVGAHRWIVILQALIIPERLRQPDPFIWVFRMKLSQVHAKCGTAGQRTIEKVHREIATDATVRKVDP